LELGAIDFVAKPQLDLVERMPDTIPEILEKVKVAATARVRPATAKRATDRIETLAARRTQAMIKTTQRVIAGGASTGGTEAIREFLMGMPADAPGIVIVQHMPEKFTKSFAERCDALCTIKVKEAEDGDRVLQGHALIAPGNYHMRLCRDGASYSVQLEQDPPVNRHRPSVDVLFQSIAETAGPNSVGIVMTGMGMDGARGLLEMKRAGARTIAQDEESCVVFGMPKEAIAMRAVDHVLPLPKISRIALELAESSIP
jgi:two-component system chemotaxis response regulator CheB